jgi:hypothetical protein
LAPPIGEAFNDHWYELPAEAVSVVFPPGQNECDPVIDGVKVPTVTLALPLAVQPPSEATTLIETGEAVPAEKMIDDVPCPNVTLPLVTDQV